LRDSLHYNGVVISDDLFNMRAITDRYSYGHAAILAINAGTDILLYVGNILRNASLLKQMVDTIETNVQTGVIAESRINSAYERIQQLKTRYAINSVPYASLGIPQHIELFQNYPNPFNPATTIAYQLSVPNRVTLKVFDVLGREVTTLVDELKLAGTYSTQWDASGVACGVYFYQLTAEGFVQTKKLILLR